MARRCALVDRYQATDEGAASVQDDADGHLIYHPGDVLQNRCTAAKLRKLLVV